MDALERYHGTNVSYIMSGSGIRAGHGRTVVTPPSLVRPSRLNKLFTWLRSPLSPPPTTPVPNLVVANDPLLLIRYLLQRPRTAPVAYYFQGVRWRTIHSILDVFGAALWTLERMAMLLSDAVIVPAEESMPAVRRTLGLPGVRKRVFVVPNAVPDRFFAQSGREARRRRMDIVFSGRITQTKHPVELVAAFGDVLKRFSDATLTMAYPKTQCDGTILERIRSSSARMGVRFLSVDSPDKMIPIYKNASCLVLPSDFEMSSLAVLEAAACGTPCLSTAVGDAQRVLGGVDSRLIIRGTDRVAIADAVSRFLAVPVQKRATIGRSLRRKVAASHTMRAAARTAREIFQHMRNPV